jgi:hypothetical protein
MGKTEIFKRVVNRLFFEQDHQDPEAVVPVYYSFPDHFQDRWDFALKYTENFLRWYAAFRLRDTTLLSAKTSDLYHLIEIIRHSALFTDAFKWTINLIEAIVEKEEGERLDLTRIQQVLLEQEGTQVSKEQIYEILVKLSRGDLLQYMELGGWFKKVEDPILLEFLKVWGKTEVLGQNNKQVEDELIQKYRRFQRQFSQLMGYFAEVYMAQILLNAQRQTLPGQYFHQETEVEIPEFTYLRLRERLGIGKDKKIDIHGAAGIEHRVAESKWYQDRKVGLSLVKKLLEKAELVKKERTPDYVRSWFFALQGFTPEAEDFMRKHQIFWSTRADLDALLTLVGLRTLPKFSE